MRRSLYLALFLIIIFALGSIQISAAGRTQAEQYYDQGLNLLQNGYSAESVRYFRKAIELNAEYLEAYYYLGKAYFNIGYAKNNREYYGQAVKCYRMVLRLNPKAVIVFGNLGLTYIYLEEYQEAITNYQAYLQSYRRDKNALYNISYSYFKIGNYQNAREYSQRAIEIDSQYADAYYLIGITYDNQGDRNRAIAYYKLAAQRGSAEAKKALDSSGIDVFTAETVEPFEADSVKPDGSSDPQKENGPKSETPSIDSYDFAFRTFILWVPGVSYTVENYDAQTSTLYTSSGTQPKSSITIKRDGTFVWNSSWDGKIIKGNWVLKNDGLYLINGQEGKTWKVEKGGGVNEDIFLLDGSIWYSGKAVTVKKKKQ